MNEAGSEWINEGTNQLINQRDLNWLWDICSPVYKYSFGEGVKFCALLQDFGQHFHEGGSGLKISAGRKMEQSFIAQSLQFELSQYVTVCHVRQLLDINFIIWIEEIDQRSFREDYCCHYIHIENLPPIIQL